MALPLLSQPFWGTLRWWVVAGGVGNSRQPAASGRVCEGSSCLNVCM